MLDSIGVHPDFGRQGIAGALLEQLCENLAALGVERLETQVDWNDCSPTSLRIARRALRFGADWKERLAEVERLYLEAASSLA